MLSRRGLLVGAASGLILPHSRARAWSFGLATPPTIGLITTGDSITGCSNDYPFQALANPDTGDCGVPLTQSTQTYYSRAAASVPLMWRNMGISGSRLNTNGFPDLVPLCATPYITQIPFMSPFKGLKFIFGTAIGANDLAVGNFGNGNYAQYAGAVASCVAGQTWANLNYICTLFPNPGGGMVESNRLGYNSTIMGAGWAVANGISLVINLAQGPLNDPTNWMNPPTIYSPDGTHLTTFAASIAAGYFLAGVNALIALL